MTTIERMAVAQTLIQAVGLVVIVLTLAVYYGQLQAMQAQLETMRRQLDATHEASHGQNILALAGFLQSEDIRAAREFVFTKLERKPVARWSERDTGMAARVCSSYTVAGVVLRSALFPSQEFLESWGPSIRRSIEILRPFIDERREQMGPAYWSAFDWLASRVPRDDRP